MCSQRAPIWKPGDIVTIVCNETPRLALITHVKWRTRADGWRPGWGYTLKTAHRSNIKGCWTKSPTYMHEERIAELILKAQALQ